MADDESTKGPPEAAPGGGAQPEPEAEDEGPRTRRVRPILEGAVADMVRRGIEAGWERVSKGERGAALRAALGDLKVPREIAAYVGSQLDDTKNAILKVVAKELREFLETSHFADELARLLTTLQFEITTTVRFVPNADGKPPRPKVTSQTKLRRRTDKE
ncbi:MAG: hypothetical protein HY907_11790 [Deltaproteobacteria bacterium]|nr:hypothetical protein [Deltaproteobacteria bacterium]